MNHFLLLPTASSSRIHQNAAKPQSLVKKISQTVIKATKELKGKSSHRFSWNSEQQGGSSVDTTPSILQHPPLPALPLAWQDGGEAFR